MSIQGGLTGWTVLGVSLGDWHTKKYDLVGSTYQGVPAE